MKLYVDANACPVTRIAQRAAKDRAIPVAPLCDTNHALTSDDSDLCQRGEIVVTRDYSIG